MPLWAAAVRQASRRFLTTGRKIKQSTPINSSGTRTAAAMIAISIKREVVSLFIALETETIGQ